MKLFVVQYHMAGEEHEEVCAIFDSGTKAEKYVKKHLMTKGDWRPVVENPKSIDPTYYRWWDATTESIVILERELNDDKSWLAERSVATAAQ